MQRFGLNPCSCHRFCERYAFVFLLWLPETLAKPVPFEGVEIMLRLFQNYSHQEYLWMHSASPLCLWCF